MLGSVDTCSQDYNSLTLNIGVLGCEYNFREQVSYSTIFDRLKISEFSCDRHSCTI